MTLETTVLRQINVSDMMVQRQNECFDSKPSYSHQSNGEEFLTKRNLRGNM